MTQRRLISLLPSATEIVCALGLGDRLVGRSHECDYPDSVRTLPVCTRSKLKVETVSAEIDRQVKSLVQNALSIYDVDSELLRSLEPDLILTQSQCEVCAISHADLERALGDWTGAKQAPRVLSLSPQRLADLWSNIREVASTLEVPDVGRDLVRRLKLQVADVLETTVRVQARPTVACVEWLDPLMAAGNWMPDLVELAGGINLFGEAGEHSPWLDFKSLRARDPEVIVCLPCGFDLARTAAELPALSNREGWSELRAVRNGRVYLADGSHYFNRPGPRLVESLEALAQMLHPDEFAPTWEGKAWQRFK